MIKVPIWVLEQLVKAGKIVNPSDLFQMSNLDDAINLIHTIMGR